MTQLPQTGRIKLGPLVGFIKLKPKVAPTANASLQTKLDALSKKYHPYLDSQTIAYNEYIKIQHLMAKNDAPVGTGSQYMKELCQLADDNKTIIVLTTANKGFGGMNGFKKTSSVTRLTNFYKKFGFVNSYSRRNYRPDLDGNMHRNPK